MIGLIGAINDYGGEAPWVSVTEEAAVAVNPDVILTCVGYLPDPVAEIMSHANWGDVTTIAGLIPHRGQVLLNGREIGGMKRWEMAGWVALMSQSHAVYFPYTVYDTAMFGRYAHMKGSLFANPSREDRAAAERCLEYTGLSDLRNRTLNALSGGQ